MSTDKRRNDDDQDQQKNDSDRNQNPEQFSNDGYISNRNRDEDSKNSKNSSKYIESRGFDNESEFRHLNFIDGNLIDKQDVFDTMADRIAKRTNRSRQDVNDMIRHWNS